MSERCPQIEEEEDVYDKCTGSYIFIFFYQTKGFMRETLSQHEMPLYELLDLFIASEGTSKPPSIQPKLSRSFQASNLSNGAMLNYGVFVCVCVCVLLGTIYPGAAAIMCGDSPKAALHYTHINRYAEFVLDKHSGMVTFILISALCYGQY